MIELKSNPLIEQRLNEFAQLHKKNEKFWFSELCFCILTANSKAQNAINIQQEIGEDGFLSKSEIEIKEIIKKQKHRFHNNKAKYIVQARQFKEIKKIILGFNDSIKARNFLAEKVKGLGYKESSHFLRNVGFSDVAIIDRHILRFLYQQNLIKEIPKTITRNKYLEFENLLKQFKIPLDKLDLIIWEKMTGKVLK